MTNTEIVTLQPIFFETNQHEIRPQFVPTLEGIARSMQRWSGITMLRIETASSIVLCHASADNANSAMTIATFTRRDSSANAARGESPSGEAPATCIVNPGRAS